MKKLCQLLLFLVGAVLSFSIAVAAERENDIVRAVRKVTPAVVNISSEYELQTRQNPYRGFGLDPFFDSFFKDFFDPGFERRYKRTSLGSGVLISGENGLILTNEHVVAQGGTISVFLQDEREFKAEIVGTDPDSDLAVLRIKSEAPLPSIEMGNSEDLMIGETIIAIGNPFGFSHTVTTGVISALNRSLRTENRIFQDFIQTDASINPGNSGGPLLNVNGELIGINTAIYAKAQGIGFAIPINKAKRIVADLLKYGEVLQPWVGMTVQELDSRLVSYLNLPDSGGVLVRSVEVDSPAQKAGFQEGDILLSDGKSQFSDPQIYQAVIAGYSAGQTLPITVWRETGKEVLYLETELYPQERALKLAWRILGVQVKPVSGNRKSGLEGVLIEKINPQSDLADIGAEPGDIIRRINDLLVTDLETFKKAVIKYRLKTSVVILLQRGFQGYHVTVRLQAP